MNTKIKAMINLEKENALKVEHVYCLRTEDYTSDYLDDWGEDGETPHIYKGSAVLSISAEDFEACKEAGLEVKEYTQIILASSNPDITVPPIRQIMYKHIVFADKVDHTNF